MGKTKPPTKRLRLLMAASLAFIMWSSAAAGETWAVYLYLCGSDLETKYASASRDITEALGVELPEEVKFIILAGGSKEWKVDGIDAEATHLLRHTGTGIDVIDTPSVMNMGHPKTLHDFLKICEENFPADRKMLILWDHGGGSAGGICYDELFDNDALSFAELQEAFTVLYGESPEEKPFEIIGFDACLMATVDMAGLCAPFANYMVASQQVIPGCGWKYDGFLSALAENPDMDGEELGRVICDTYYEGCEELGLEDDITLSVINLDTIADLNLALSLLAFEGISTMLDNPSTFYAELGRGAKKADKYRNGMVDLFGLVGANSRLFPEAAEIVQEAVKDSVVYQVTGPYRRNSHGIAAFLPSSGDDAAYGNFAVASGIGGAKSFYHLFEPLMTGGFSDEAVAFMDGLPEFLTGLDTDDEEDDDDDSPGPGLTLVSPGSLAGAMNFADTSGMGLDDHPIEFIEDDDGITSVRLTLGEEKASVLKSVTFMLALTDEKFTELLFLGEDSDADVDWDDGVFSDNFRGVWGAIDGYYVMMHVTSIADGYVLYEVPLIVDEKMYNLTVAYDYDSRGYRMLAARLDDSEAGGIPSREERLLKEGDSVTTVFYKVDIQTGKMDLFPNETFTLGKKPRFSELTLPDGMYAMLFLMTDYKENYYYSDIAGVTIDDGDTEIFDLDEYLADLADDDEDD